MANLKSDFRLAMIFIQEAKDEIHKLKASLDDIHTNITKE